MWFYNHGCSNIISSSTGTHKLLKLNLQAKLLQVYEVYHRLTYESKWKLDINTGWKTYQANWKAENPGRNFNITRLEYMNNFIRDKYKNKTPKMKAEAEKH